jgi:hypothetical protein
VTFGGGNTGVAYASRDGSYTRIKDRYCVNLRIDLSSKGSATGAMEITGLPAAASADASASGWISNAAAGFTGAPQFLIGNGSTTLRPYEFAAGSATQLTDAKVNNNTIVIASGCYKG